MSQNKEKLIPVQVPWQVSYSTPFLTLIITEFAPRYAEFVGSFRSPESGFHERKVKLIFEGSGAFRAKIGSDERNAINDDDYDWSGVPLRIQPDEDLKNWGIRFNRQWEDTGTCPNPLMYEVVNSKWLTSSDVSYGVKHFLIVGEIMYAEILCVSWAWEAGEIIDWMKT